MWLLPLYWYIQLFIRLPEYALTSSSAAARTVFNQSKRSKVTPLIQAVGSRVAPDGAQRMIPKHRSIFEALKEQIAAGKYPEGKRLPSETELAVRFKVSRPTAARALRDLQALGLIRRRAGSGTYLNRSVDPDSKPLKQTFGLLVPGLGNTEILDPICNEITRFAQSLGSEVLWGGSADPLTTAEDALALCRQYIDRKVDGVFLAPMETVPDRAKVNQQISTMLQEVGIPAVLLDRDASEFPVRSQHDLVGINNFSAGFVLTEYLLELGNRNFRFLARPNYPSTTDLRLAGCREALNRARLTQAQPFEWFGEPSDVAFVKSMLSPNLPNAIICSNDQIAAKLIQTLSFLGVRLPQDVRVVGFDDVRYATLLSVPLTTIRMPCGAIGRAAVRAMQERIRHPNRTPQEIFLPFRLVVRYSCGGAVAQAQEALPGRSGRLLSRCS
jgi:GntR family transcriptional regulator of arabinose operon